MNHETDFCELIGDLVILRVNPISLMFRFVSNKKVVSANCMEDLVRVAGILRLKENEGAEVSCVKLL